MRKVKVIWDLEDGFENDVDVMFVSNVVSVPDNIQEEDIADYLSDKYNFCVKSFYYE